MAYDQNNVFARILRGEIPCRKIYEDDFILCIHDIAPLKPIHALMIVKGAYMHVNDFMSNAQATEIAGFWQALPKIVQILGMTENGYRLISNCLAHGQPEVPHFHVHILGGEPVGPLVG